MAGSGNGKQWQQILAEAEKQGLLVERPGDRVNGDGSKKKGRHTRVTNPKTGDFVTVANTPSEYRGINNAVSQMRRTLGFQWKGH